MSKYLNKAPLVHVIVQLRFAPIPELSKLPKLENTGITKQMVNIGFQEKIESETQPFVITSGTNVTTIKHPNRLLFRAAGQRDCVSLSDRDVILKTTLYTGFDEFNTKFDKILSVIENTVPGIKNAIVKNIGFRYTNVIAPEENYTLKDYLVDDILPVINILDAYKESNIGTLHASVVTGDNQTLRVMIEEILTQDGKISKILPIDLMERDKNAALLINGHEYWKNIVAPRYALLELEHVYEFPESPIYNKIITMDKFKNLHQLASKTFWNLITDTAKAAWQETNTGDK